MNPLHWTYKALRRGLSELRLFWERRATSLQFALNGVECLGSWKTKGIPTVQVSKGGRLLIGDGFRMNNGPRYNRIGREQDCKFIVGERAEIIIGRGVAMSHSALVAKESIRIGDHCMLGGNVCIYDTDFHALDANARQSDDDEALRNNAPVVLGEHVFVGAHSIILKGVSIGDGAIIGAGSVVAKNIPAGEIWAGNPAKFIKRVPSNNIKVA